MSREPETPIGREVDPRVLERTVREGQTLGRRQPIGETAEPEDKEGA